MAVNRIAYLFAGAVLGAAGMAMVKSGKGKELVSGVINGGCGVAENVLARVETIKEDIEDYMAEVKYNKAEKEQQAQTAQDAEDSVNEDDAVVVNETVFEPEEEGVLVDVEIEIAPEDTDEESQDAEPQAQGEAGDKEASEEDQKK